MTTSFEDQLREELHTAVSGTSLRGPDVGTVIGQGHRAVKRRRVLQVASVAAVVAVLAVGTTLPWGGPPGALPATPAPSSVAGQTGSTRITLSENGGPSHTYVVSISPSPEKGGIEISYAEQTSSGVLQLGGSAIDPAVRLVTWAHSGSSPTVMGLIPSGTAKHQLLVETQGGDFGGYTWGVEPIAGTDFSAFAATFDKPLQDASVTSVTWFDQRGRPVDSNGGVGSAVTVGGQLVWLSADGSTYGTEEFSNFVAQGAAALSYSVGQVGTQGWRVIGLLAPEAVKGAVRQKDGPELPFTTARLGDHAVFVARTGAGAAQPVVRDVRWTDAAGQSQTSTPRT